MRGRMPKSTDLVNAFQALSPSEQKAFLNKVGSRRKPGPVALSRAQVHRATREVLMELLTVNGKPFDNWLMRLTDKELEALQRTPTRKRTLSLDAWKRTTEGWAVFQREAERKEDRLLF